MITIQSLIRVTYVQQNFKTTNVEGSFLEEEGLEGEVKSGWISVGNRGGSLFQICGPTTSIDLTSRVARRADDLTREPLVADLSSRLAGICAVRVKGRYDGAWPRRDLKTRKRDFVVNSLANASPVDIKEMTSDMVMFSFVYDFSSCIMIIMMNRWSCSRW